MRRRARRFGRIRPRELPPTAASTTGRAKTGKIAGSSSAADSYLQEIDARTGASIHSFGVDGRVNLREGLGRDPKTIPEIQTGTPGHVFENMIILGSATSESYGSPPGDIRAYDVLTGKTGLELSHGAAPG